ncbi:hypothetical protein ACVILE_002875 [Streptomyces sp. M18.1]|nr:hypothetical protein DBP22_00180 [Streptomyces sp. CS207]
MMTISAPSWDSPAAALLISGKDLAPQDVTRTLGITPSLTREPTAASRFRPGEGVWVVQVTARPGQGLDGALDELVGLVSGRLRSIQSLRESGLTVRIDLSGQVDGRARLPVSPHSLSRLAALALPLSFTTRAVPSERSEEAWDWLPEADGSHRTPESDPDEETHPPAAASSTSASASCPSWPRTAPN